MHADPRTLGAFLRLAGLAVVVLIWFGKIIGGLDSLGWRKDFARVTKLYAVRSSCGRYHGYAPRVEYEYFVSGIRYTGDQLDHELDTIYRSEDKALTAINEKYCPGQDIVISVHPKNPQLSVLKAGIRPSSLVGFAVSALILIAVFIFIWRIA